MCDSVGMALKLYKSSSWWYADFSVNGQRKTVPLGVRVEGRRPGTLREEGCPDFEESRARARVAHERMKLELGDARRRERAIQALRAEAEAGELLVRDLAGYAEKELKSAGRSAGHVKAVRKVVEDFAGRFPGSRPVHGIDRAGVKRWHDSVVGSARTRNKKRGMICWLFNRLRADGFVDVSPAEGLRVVPEVTRHRAPLEWRELVRVIRAAGSFRPVVWCGICTGMRLMDCARLRWEDVDLEEGWISVRTGKTGARAEIPLHRVLRNALGDPGAGYCFPEFAGHHPASVSHLYTRIRRAAGVEKDFHALRVSFITAAVARGVPVDVLRKVTGHASVDVVLKHYVQLDRERIRAAWRVAGV